jgi:hypothetical protein
MLPRQCLAVVTRRTLELLQCHEASQRALDVVVDLLERFLEETGRRAAQNRDLASRQAGTFMDVAHALRDLGIPLESFAKRLKEQPLVKHSGLERECPLSVLCGYGAHISCTGLPRFPVDPALELPPALVVDEDGPEAPFPEEAPSWLPPLPPRHSYVHTAAPAAVAVPVQEQARLKRERRLQVEGRTSFSSFRVSDIKVRATWSECRSARATMMTQWGKMPWRRAVGRLRNRCLRASTKRGPTRTHCARCGERACR